MSYSSNRPVERVQYFMDRDGADAIGKRYDEIIPYTWDLALTNELAPGDYVSTWAYVDSGVTRSLVLTTGSSVSFSASKTGETEITATTAAGRKHQRVVRFYGIDTTAQTSDYR